MPNGIDVEQVRSAHLLQWGYDVLSAGRLIEHNNVDVLLDVFDEVVADNDATLCIVGDGPEPKRLEKKRESPTHIDRVEFPNFLNDYDDVLDHMCAVDVFASPSTREGFGITFVEATTADCTVIAATHPDLTADEVIDDAGFPVERAQRYDWDVVADQRETAY